MMGKFWRLWRPKGPIGRGHWGVGRGSLCGKAGRGAEMASHPDGVTCRSCRRMMGVPKEFYQAREALPLHDATLILVLTSWWSEGRAKCETKGKRLSVGQWLVALQEVDRRIDATLFKYRAEFAGYVESRVRLLVETLGYDELVQMATAVRDGREDELVKLAEAFRTRAELLNSGITQFEGGHER